MAEEKNKPAPSPDEMVPGDATPHNPGISPKPGDPAGDGKPAEGAPSDRKPDPSQQPS